MKPDEASTHTEYIFDPLWCRSVEFLDDGTTPMSDMNVNRYVQSAEVYNNSLHGHGFCTGGKCPRYGAMNSTACQGMTYST